MNRLIITLSVSMLGGCVAMGRVGLHPEGKTACFDDHPYQVESCLTGMAQNQQVYLEQADPLLTGTKRYNLGQDNETVAWIEIAKYSHHQTSVTFYYDPKAPDISARGSAMITV